MMVIVIDTLARVFRLQMRADLSIAKCSVVHFSIDNFFENFFNDNFASVTGIWGVK
jgi:hypothetical protein